ncbi:MAG: DEAD/DEAH box helicase [Candidatus Portnoybacteria bacterium]|nr:DEAD/DEAH box helicase [Candidatus Portnoybacteria bacterium]
MISESKNPTKILIASLSPYFLDRDIFWFSENQKKIEEVAKTQIWWKDNTIFLEKNQRINLFELLRKLTNFGYERVQTLARPGELSQRGGILDIFPINMDSALRLEFSGNELAEIFSLEIKIDEKPETIKKALKKQAPSQLLANLKPNEYLVHLDHGIGIFKGFAKELGGELSFNSPTPESQEKYFVLEYAKNDRLYVPLELEEKLTRYIGFETPIVHRLGGTLWYKTKRKIKESALNLAKELLEIYAKRAAVSGFKFPPDDALQKELEDSFLYIETEDQLSAMRDVKKDMESEKPMDRLICGDVGFGKTEIALRAAFKAVTAGKQVALITPTTILAHQHYHNFLNRLKKFPINIALLSRLESKKNQAQTIKQIKDSQTDIVIGTHRLIQKDVEFPSLGLVIIDEEQRFGVKQKERFKEMRANIDILSLSATPIPRTMHLSLTGLRDISLIQTAPPGRLAVKTFIEPYSPKTIKKAIEFELKRGGQIYYLHNRIETIELAKKQIEKLLKNSSLFKGRLGGIYSTDGDNSKNPPHPSLPTGQAGFKKEGGKIYIAIAHGRMNEKQLIKVMDDFGEKKIDILVATTIIENGLDFPNVNTLIVANATKLGLAQSYQLRGRIGRSDKQAYAYFLYNEKNLTDIAQQRLDALKEAQALGSGYQIALRDLEIRGAGNILGREQSGQINAVGLNLYIQMLNEAVDLVRNYENV